MIVYNKKKEDLPKPTEGTHEMTCVYEGPSTKNAEMHCFLFKNERSQIWHQCFPSQIIALAEALQVPLEPDGAVETERFKNLTAKVTVGWVRGKGGQYLQCTDFKPFFNPVPPPELKKPRHDEDEEIPF